MSRRLATARGTIAENSADQTYLHPLRHGMANANIHGALSPFALKLALLMGTVLFAVDARLRLIANLNERNLVALAWPCGR